MKVLVLFLDMVRANRLNIINKNNTITPLDEFLNNLGGEVYTNAFSSFPDTGRALANFLSGEKSFINGCNVRVKYPYYFLKSKTIIDDFLEKKYKIDIYLNQRNILPANLFNNKKVNIKFESDLSLKDFLKNISLRDKHFIFLDIPIFHEILDIFGYTKRGEKIAYEKLVNRIKEIFDIFEKDEFDEIFIFSDHGFKFKYETILQRFNKKKYLLLNEDRTQILFFHRKKGDDNLNFKDNLVNLSDFHQLIKSKLNKNDLNFDNEYIVIEDHFSFDSSESKIEIWGIVTKKEIYIRTKNKAVILIRDSREEIKGINKNYDEILLNESPSFKEYFLLMMQKKRPNTLPVLKKRHKILNLTDAILDILKRD